MADKEMMREFRGLLDDTAGELHQFLETNLSALEPNWWRRRVLDCLTEAQRAYVLAQDRSDMAVLDLAQLLRVFDLNWQDIRRKARLQNRARNFLKEMQTIRNEWAHMNAKGVGTDRLKREFSTLRGFLESIDADQELLEKVKGLENDIWSARAKNERNADLYRKSTSGDRMKDARTGGKHDRLELGHCYTRRQISQAIGGGGLQIFLPNKQGRVLAACIDPAKNPGAPEVVLAGRGPDVEKAATLLSDQEGPIPVFLKESTNHWCYHGMFTVARVIVNPVEINLYAEKAGRQGNVSCVFILKKT